VDHDASLAVGAVTFHAAARVVQVLAVCDRVRSGDVGYRRDIELDHAVRLARAQPTGADGRAGNQQDHCDGGDADNFYAAFHRFSSWIWSIGYGLFESNSEILCGSIDGASIADAKKLRDIKETRDVDLDLARLHRSRTAETHMATGVSFRRYRGELWI